MIKEKYLYELNKLNLKNDKLNTKNIENNLLCLEQFKVKDSKLFISSGLGTTNQSNIRLFCRPSINFFRLSNS